MGIKNYISFLKIKWMLRGKTDEEKAKLVVNAFIEGEIQDEIFRGIKNE